MTRSAAAQAEEGLDLGGGFRYVQRAGDDAILPPRLALGCETLMSTARVNARDESVVMEWATRWGLGSVKMVYRCHQEHGAHIVRAGELAAAPGAPDEARPKGDGLWTDRKDVALFVSAADCAPVWIADGGGARLALVHAGWRGIEAGVVAAAIAALRGAGSDSASLALAVGPHLQQCCFEVGPEVAQRFAAVPGAVAQAAALRVDRRRNDSVALNLGSVIRSQCVAAGLAEHQLHLSTACTRCNPELLHSYRRNGTGGPLMAALGVLRA
ncbi:MAG: polyphenol oxidase family protein [Candidatus Eremiobacteraeota bacterium]|nr:polyphenol oxidase family protein [Candidatus Eremiobacteraeota bacterium]